MSGTTETIARVETDKPLEDVGRKLIFASEGNAGRAMRVVEDNQVEVGQVVFRLRFLDHGNCLVRRENDADAAVRGVDSQRQLVRFRGGRKGQVSDFDLGDVDGARPYRGTWVLARQTCGDGRPDSRAIVGRPDLIIGLFSPVNSTDCRRSGMNSVGQRSQAGTPNWPKQTIWNGRSNRRLTAPRSGWDGR